MMDSNGLELEGSVIKRKHSDMVGRVKAELFDKSESKLAFFDYVMKDKDASWIGSDEITDDSKYIEGDDVFLPPVFDFPSVSKRQRVGDSVHPPRSVKSGNKQGGAREIKRRPPVPARMFVDFDRVDGCGSIGQRGSTSGKGIFNQLELHYKSVMPGKLSHLREADAHMANNFTIAFILKSHTQWNVLIQKVRRFEDGNVVITEKLLDALIALTKRPPLSVLHHQDCLELDALWKFETHRCSMIDQWLRKVISNDLVQIRLAEITKLMTDLQENATVSPDLYMRFWQALTTTTKPAATRVTRKLCCFWKQLADATPPPAEFSKTQITAVAARRVEDLTLILTKYAAFLEKARIAHPENVWAPEADDCNNGEMWSSYGDYIAALERLHQQPAWLLAYAPLIGAEVPKKALMDFCLASQELNNARCVEILEAVARLPPGEITKDNLNTLWIGDKNPFGDCSDAWCRFLSAVEPKENDAHCIDALKRAFKDYYSLPDR
eukprot:Blabericola_migrator_1__7263@NODE_368_length_9339_cov_86_801014_g295_i0_p3_GENE_NODE_368_length_9339_cov_86_801014_g295_i0NODE_368_length_9339_cov_86_801014_g295_i0_p3_ORF_typecomplete_len495_score88_50_NODE_368_length_9339_cov_86_801014_g295_i011472631